MGDTPRTVLLTYLGPPASHPEHGALIAGRQYAFPLEVAEYLVDAHPDTWTHDAPRGE